MKTGSNLVNKSLYRSILRQARKIDKNPALKFLVVAKPKSAYHMKHKSIINFNFDAHDLNNFIERFTGGGQFYRPESSVTQLVQNAFRTEEKLDETELVSTAFSALRFLADINDMNQDLLESWQIPQEEILREPSENKNELKQITDFRSIENFTGRLLITHPVSCLDQEGFHRAVILLQEDKVENALTGYIINKPQIGRKLKDLWTEGVGKQFPNLAMCDVWNGGVMHGFAFLHTCPDIEGSQEIDTGLYIHPMTSVDDTLKQFKKFQDAVEEKRTSVENIKFLHGVCGWWREQLLSELERTVWFLTDPPEEGVNTYVESADSSEASNMWENLVHRFGGEYEQLARNPDFPSKILQRLNKGQKDAINQLLKDL